MSIGLCLLLTSCKQHALQYPLLNEKLQAIPLQPHDIRITHQRPFPFATRPYVKSGFSTPLHIPDTMQMLAESILSQHDSILPVSGDIFKLLQDTHVPPQKKPRPRKLTHTLKAINRHSNKDFPYEHVFAWMAHQPTALADIVALLLYALDEADRDITIATQKLSAEEQEYLKKHITQLALHHIGSENTIPFDQKLLALCDAVDYNRIIAASLRMTYAIGRAKEIIHTMPTLPIIPEAFSFETPLGQVIIGSSVNDQHTTSACLIIDLSGDDSYLEHAGQTPESSIQILFDYLGNDVYRTHDDLSFASSILGISILYDYTGHDFYAASDMSLGCGILGAGILIDEHGDDEFKMNQCGIGAGIYGLGIVYNKKGNDYYYGQLYCQAFSMTQGTGLLLDIYGNDFYSAGGKYDGWAWSEESYKSASQGFSMGIREYAPGGFSYLLDATGNDSYHGSTLCQGAGYWLGMGILHDVMGNDFYTALHYAQGAGVHSAIGVLLDNEGADMYKSLAASQGLGYHQSIGILVDYAGNDHYSAKQLSAGSGSLMGIGILNDKQGNDSYQIHRVNENSLGRGTTDNGISSIGLFLDEHGTDYYVYAPQFKNSDRATSRYSLRSDAEAPLDIFTKLPLFIPRKDTAQTYYAHVELPSTDDDNIAQKLYAIIVNEHIQPSTRAQAATMLQTLDEKTIDYLITCIRSPSFSQALSFPKKYVQSVHQEINPRLMKEITHEKDDYIKSKLCLYLSSGKESELITTFVRSEWKKAKGPATKSALLQVLTHFRDLDSERIFVTAMSDANTFVVLQALKSVRSLKLAETTPAIIPLLEHDHFYIREYAAQTLLSFGDTVLQRIETEYHTAEGVKKELLTHILEQHRNSYR